MAGILVRYRLIVMPRLSRTIVRANNNPLMLSAQIIVRYRTTVGGERLTSSWGGAQEFEFDLRRSYVPVPYYDVGNPPEELPYWTAFAPGQEYQLGVCQLFNEQTGSIRDFDQEVQGDNDVYRVRHPSMVTSWNDVGAHVNVFAFEFSQFTYEK